MDNPNPVVHETAPRERGAIKTIENVTVDAVFEVLRDINDPEYPNSLEELAVVVRSQIFLTEDQKLLRVEYTPTVPHCSMATLIGLCIRLQLMRTIPYEYNLDVYITEGRHSAEDAINKQLNDKERVAAALENPHLMGVVEKCLATERQAGIALNV